MRYFLVFLISFICFFQTALLTSAAVPTVQTADPRISSKLDTAYKQYICAWAALAAYDGRVQEVARSELSQHGWKVIGFHRDTAKADAKFYLVERTADQTGDTMDILAIAGTENDKDIASDMKFRKVPFGGTVPAAFKSIADNGHITSQTPMVHQGFNEYTNTVFFTPVGSKGDTLGESLAAGLKSNPKAHILLTGHSLGGAVATLMAARLIDIGVPAKQIEVISFGAPAVGNQAFSDIYGKELLLDRVVIKNDPVKGVLQTITSGEYKQFGKKTEWYRNPNSDQFFHAVALYADAALRNYYDIKNRFSAERNTLGNSSAEPPIVYAGPISFQLDECIQNDEKYMRQAVQEELRRRFSGHIIFSAGKVRSLESVCAEAALAGYSYIVLDFIQGVRMKNLPYRFKLSFLEEVFDTAGNLITTSESITDTAEMTPIESVLYLQAKAQTSLQHITHIEKTA
ncbi:lipase family protein [Megasphaera paucivorans]|uniref:Lipase (Class 3) n=1 Tax=Megasphaera paucivorans TaxID=349095 RepID=A0A1G9RYL7_9FIRM|nr:lipase family protein [Megasphaera paucivorans]SDM28262.1 Lipase (class 3) [Megasphaera paucivorans]